MAGMGTAFNGGGVSSRFGGSGSRCNPVTMLASATETSVAEPTSSRGMMQKRAKCSAALHCCAAENGWFEPKVPNAGGCTKVRNAQKADFAKSDFARRTGRICSIW